MKLTDQDKAKRSHLKFRLMEELERACKDVQRDALYKVFKSVGRYTFNNVWLNQVPLEDLQIILEQVREENNKNIF